MTPEQSPLGKSSTYTEHYDVSLLFPIARKNAREAIGNSGRIGVRAISVTGADGSREAVIEVSDSGRGMSEEFIRTRIGGESPSPLKKP